MPFTVMPVITPISENGIRTRWRVVEPMNFYSEKFRRNFVVPADTITDLASGLFSAAAAASILHDHLYEDGIRLKQIKNWSEADEVFFEAMLDTGVPLWRCWLYFGAVRIFGKSFYQPTGGKK